MHHAVKELLSSTGDLDKADKYLEDVQNRVENKTTKMAEEENELHRRCKSSLKNWN